MAAFYSFLASYHDGFPEPDARDHRIASFVGAAGSDQLISGPAFDTVEINDVHEILTLIGLAFEELQPIRRNDGGLARFAWIGFAPILSITPEIVFALDEAAARDFLLDLKTAVEMMKVIRPHEQGGCMIEIIPPQAG